MSRSPLYYRVAVCVLGVLIVTPFAARGQETASPAPSPIAAPVVGDVLTLKNGTLIVGQIVGSGPGFFAVQILETVDPLRVDRSFVVSIEYDNLDPLRSRRASTAGVPDGGTGNTVESDEISPQLVHRLGARFLKAELQYKDHDVIEILKEVEKLSGVEIKIHPAVRDMDEMSRRWTFVADRSMTVLNLVQNRMFARFKNLKAELKFNHVVVSVKETTPVEANQGPGS